MTVNLNQEPISISVSSQELLKTPETVSLTEKTLGLAGTAQKGPAFVPKNIATFEIDNRQTGVLNTFENTFGEILNADRFYESTASAYEWFNQGGKQVSYVRLLGLGEDEVEGYNETAGFNVSEHQVSGSINSHFLEESKFAQNSIDSSAGETVFIGSLLYEKNYKIAGTFSSYQDYFAQIGIQSNKAAFITNAVFTPQKVSLHFNADNIDDSQITSVIDDLNTDPPGEQYSFDKKTKEEYPRLFLRGLTTDDGATNAGFSYMKDFRPTHLYSNNHLKTSFKENRLNVSSNYYLEKGHLCYAKYHLPIQKEALLKRPGNPDTNFHFIAKDSTERFNNFYSTFKTSKTPWITSQSIDRLFIEDASNRINMHKRCIKLFRFHAYDDGEIGNRFRIRITPLKAGSIEEKKWARFNLEIFEYLEEQNRFTSLTTYKSLNLDPDSPDYICLRVGTKYEYYNPTTKKIETKGIYEQTNNYIRVEINDKIEFKEIDAYNLIPSGFMPYPRLNIMKEKFDVLESLNEIGLDLEVLQFPISYVQNLPLTQVDPKVDFDHAHWGVIFNRIKLNSFSEEIEGVTYNLHFSRSAEEGSEYVSKYFDYTKYFQDNYTNQSRNSWVYDLEDNEEDLTNAFFHLEKILTLNINSSKDFNRAIYRRDAEPKADIFLLNQDLANHYEYLDIEETLGIEGSFDSPYSKYLSFDMFTFGGFDGVNILDNDKKEMNHTAFLRELEGEIPNSDKKFGPTSKAYELSHYLLTDDANAEIDLLSFPEVGHKTFNKLVSNTAGNKQKYIALINSPEHDSTDVIKDTKVIKINPASNLPVQQYIDRELRNKIAQGILTNINVARELYFNNKYTLNLSNSLASSLHSDFSFKLQNTNSKYRNQRLNPSFVAIKSSAASFNLPFDFSKNYNNSIFSINGIWNYSINNVNSNEYSRIINLSTHSNCNLNLILPSDGLNDRQIKLNSANASIENRNSLSRYAHNTSIMLDIKKNLKYMIYTEELLFDNYRNIETKFRSLLERVLSFYTENGIIKDYYVKFEVPSTNARRIDMLNNIYRTCIYISLFGKKDDSIEEISLSNILNLLQNNLTETVNQNIILTTRQV